MARYRNDVPSPQVPDFTALETFRDHYVDVDSKADWALSNVNAAEEPLQHSLLMTKLPYLNWTCRRVDISVSSSNMDVVDFSFRRVPASDASDVFTNDAFRCTAEV